LPAAPRPRARGASARAARGAPPPPPPPPAPPPRAPCPRLWHGWGAQPPVSRAFHELLPSLLYHRHNREYTADELAYYLALQGKDLYDFRLDRIYYSDALDAPHEIPAVRGQRVGPRELRLSGRLRRLFPPLRGQLMARARRGAASVAG